MPPLRPFDELLRSSAARILAVSLGGGESMPSTPALPNPGTSESRAASRVSSSDGAAGLASA